MEALLSFLETLDHMVLRMKDIGADSSLRASSVEACPNGHEELVLTDG